MKILYRVTQACFSGIGAKKLSLLVHTALWFPAGAVLIWPVGLVLGFSGEEIRTLTLSAGSFTSLAFGFVGGALWLV